MLFSVSAETLSNPFFGKGKSNNFVREQRAVVCVKNVWKEF